MARRAALGFHAHSGWAVLVVVTGTSKSFAVVERRKIELVSRGIPRQPYHASEGLALPAARTLIRRSEATAKRLARAAMRSVIDEFDAQGIRIASCGILLASGRPQTSLAKTLASHAMIHSAEGELFRNAIIAAGEQLKVPVTAVKQSDLTACLKAKLGIDRSELIRRVNGMRARLGPPWTQDEKLASVAAWLSLA